MQTETELSLSIWQRSSTFGYQADSAKHFIFKILQYFRNRIQIKQNFTSPRQKFLSNTLDNFCRRPNPNPFFCSLSRVLPSSQMQLLADFLCRFLVFAAAGQRFQQRDSSAFISSSSLDLLTGNVLCFCWSS